MKTLVTAAALAAGALRADGPHVQIAENNGAYSTWDCEQADDGLWYLFLGD
jgi:hypothetical protein